MEQNKSAKYVKYAFGEIILVVIGILIALQINNWNENRKILQTEKEILKNLKSELIINRDRFEVIHQYHITEYEDCLTLLGYFNSDVSNIPHVLFDSLLGNIEMFWSFEPNDGYIKSLIASGKIDYIKNVELKALLTAFDGQVLDATQEAEPLQKLMHQRLWPALDGKINGLNRIKTLDGYDEFPAGTYTSDYQWYFSNREMEDLMANIAAWKKSLVSDEQTLKANILKMLQLVDENYISN